VADRFLDVAYAEAFVGENVLESLFIDRSDADVFNETKFWTVVEAASSAARSALKSVGYEVSGTNISSDLVKLSTLHAFVPLAFARRQQSPPEALTELIQGLLNDVRAGSLPVPDLTPDPASAIGGHVWTSSDPDVSGSRVDPLKDLRKVMG
jgi:hypothetical protein